ncbi:class I SAM-dependent methyltransferase [Microcystis elabens FACHB-917]|nr:class I SAM-dependent methyltransferase [Microcystis elabens FACHB-917]
MLAVGGVTLLSNAGSWFNAELPALIRALWPYGHAVRSIHEPYLLAGWGLPAAQQEEALLSPYQHAIKLRIEMQQTTKERAESLELLAPRLEINQRCQDRDFQVWLQSRLSVQAGERVLDLACGNGAQSQYFDKRIGINGYMRCVDIHEPSIDYIKEHVRKGDGREFVVSDMMSFASYLREGDDFTLAHCSFALPYASNPALVIGKLAKSIQRPLGRVAISLPCKPHGMFELAKSIHPVPETVEPAIDMGESLCIDLFRELFGEVDVSYFNSSLTFVCGNDFMRLYRSTTYYSQAHDKEVGALVRKRIDDCGFISFKKSAILIIGRDPA